MSTFVIVSPGAWGHVCDDPNAHLVVPVEEWVQVYHGEKRAYDAPVHCPDYDSAQNERNRLNEPPAEEPDEPEVAVEVEGRGVQWLGAKAS